jgi:hypothetical protein
MMSQGPDVLACEDHCVLHSPDYSACLQKCSALDTDLEFFGDIETLRLPGRESFACKYQNYYHPLCLKWVEFLLNLKKSGWADSAPLPDMDVTYQLLSEAVAGLINEMDYKPSDFSESFRTFTPEGITALMDERVLLVPPDYPAATYADLYSRYPILIYFYGYQYPTGFTSVYLPDELKKYNPCDLLHQSKIKNFGGSRWWQIPASGPRYNTHGNNGTTRWWFDPLTHL